MQAWDAMRMPDGREPRGRGLSTSQAGRFANAIATPGPSALNSAGLECSSSHQHRTCGHLLAHIVEAGLRACLLVYIKAVVGIPCTGV